jgi:hypothetical protein
MTAIRAVLFDIGGVLEITPTTTLPEAELRIARALGLDGNQVAALMNDLWAEYLGEINGPLYAWFRGCPRPRPANESLARMTPRSQRTDFSASRPARSD